MNLKFQIFLLVLIFVEINAQDVQVDDTPRKYCDDQLVQVVRTVCAEVYGVKSPPNIPQVTNNPQNPTEEPEEQPEKPKETYGVVKKCCEEQCNKADIESFCKGDRKDNANDGKIKLPDGTIVDINN
ncbi:unnamed protein product [Diabrotica balteata]|uniref:Insulin-like domain-containing protein n=1 Tax=Diabrotica balteata TaxID=107213 RepID=A0A9N9SZF3_DIABA|nr:unnamed protein product [Diabrotica balteata]